MNRYPVTTRTGIVAAAARKNGGDRRQKRWIVGQKAIRQDTVLAQRSASKMPTTCFAYPTTPKRELSFVLNGACQTARCPSNFSTLSLPVKAAFTLLETLVVFTVVAVLVAVAIPATTRVSQYSARMKAISNMRQIGVAAHLYANDHNQQLPGHPADAGLPAARDRHRRHVAAAFLRNTSVRAIPGCSSTRATSRRRNSR